MYHLCYTSHVFCTKSCWWTRLKNSCLSFWDDPLQSKYWLVNMCNIYIYTYVYMCNIYIYTHTHIYIYIESYIMYIYIYIYTYIIYIYIYIHHYTHIFVYIHLYPSGTISWLLNPLQAASFGPRKRLASSALNRFLDSAQLQLGRSESDLGVSIHGGAQNGWFTMESPIYKWMMTGGTPILGHLHMILWCVVVSLPGI